MVIYANIDLLDWFTSEFPKHSNLRRDMGKSCIRFKKIKEIPCDLIGEPNTKMICEKWIRIYDFNIKR